VDNFTVGYKTSIDCSNWYCWPNETYNLSGYIQRRWEKRMLSVSDLG
jgi:hypothetical protein